MVNGKFLTLDYQIAKEVLLSYKLFFYHGYYL